MDGRKYGASILERVWECTKAIKELGKKVSDSQKEIEDLRDALTEIRENTKPKLSAREIICRVPYPSTPQGVSVKKPSGISIKEVKTSGISGRTFTGPIRSSELKEKE